MPYHHGNLRAALLEAGVELARERGPSGVALREVARRTSVSHNAAYRHFADHDALLAEIAAHGAAELEAAMVRRLDTVRDGDPASRARRRLREIGRAYVEFALAEPGLFATTFGAEGHEVDVPHGSGKGATRGGDARTHVRAHITRPRLDAGGAEASGAEPAPYVLLGQVLDELVDAGAMPREYREGADTACWAAVHGFAVLHHSGPLRDTSSTERDADLETLLDTIERGLAG
jgi:AcrR family transcriptional regulator